MNVVIPMAGAGRRFQEAGYTFPKPLIDVDGAPMIQRVVESLGLQGRHIFLVQWEHLRRYAIADLLARIMGTRPYTILPVRGITEGAACTVLLARALIDNDEPLVIANSDQIIEWDERMRTFGLHDPWHPDGAILTFISTHPKWSYARLNEDGWVSEVAEKRPISDLATCGVYWFRHGSDFVAGADAMIAADARVNGEFYVAPVFNELIAAGKKILTMQVRKMHGLGTPEDLEAYQRKQVTGYRREKIETAAIEPREERR